MSHDADVVLVNATPPASANAACAELAQHGNSMIRAGGNWYLLTVLVVVYVFSFIDRQIISLIVEPLKNDLHISDTQVSLLHGFTFAIFLAFAGLPIGRLVDTRRRITIVAVGIAMWSAMTAASGLVAGYAALMLCRIGIAVGEATLTPASHSMIADSFPPQRLGLALGIYGTGTFIGMGMAYLIGAVVIAGVAGNTIALPLIGTLHPWQLVFIAVGLPGLLVAFWAALLDEPARHRVAHSTEAAPLREVAAYFRKHLRAIMLLNLTLAFTAMMAYSLTAWAPSFLIRTFGWTAPQAGGALGPIIMIFGVLGTIVGGALSDRAVQHSVSGRVLVMTGAAALSIPFAIAAPLVSHPVAALALLAVVVLLATIVIGIGPSATAALMPARMRGMASALGVLTVSVIGLGFGPTAIALMTDHVFADPLKIRYSLACLLPVMLLLSTACGLACIQPYRHSVRPLVEE
ncbi:MAG: MFS transporter [Steroidobacter sp.]